MRVCFLILAHQHPRILARLIRRLQDADCPVAVHLDRKSPADFKAVLRTELESRYDDIIWAEPVSVGWGEWSMVQATLNGLQAIRSANVDPDYVYLLSGADYPLRPLGELKTFLERHEGRNYIESVDAERHRWVTHGSQKSRFRYRHWFSWKKHPFLYTLSIELQKVLGLERKFPEGYRPHLGSQWWTLTWATCLAVLERAEDRDLMGFFRRTWVPDELFFQTVVRSIVPEPGLVDSRHLTLYQFSAAGTPLNYYNGHEEYLARQPYFFARKISPFADRLRDHLDQLAAMEIDRPPLTDETVGRATPDYQRFLRTHGHGLVGHRSMLRIDDDWMGALEWNKLPYFVLMSEDPDALDAARKIVATMERFHCHGRLMGSGPIEFAGDTPRYAGFSRDDQLIRDQDPRGFLVDVLQEQPDRFNGYLLELPRVGQRVLTKTTETMARAHTWDPQAVIMLLLPDTLDLAGEEEERQATDSGRPSFRDAAISAEHRAMLRRLEWLHEARSNPGAMIITIPYRRSGRADVTDSFERAFRARLEQAARDHLNSCLAGLDDEDHEPQSQAGNLARLLSAVEHDLKITKP